MFKPVKIYYESLLDIDPNVQEHTCRDEYWKLSDSKKTEYIKMSEKKYEIYANQTNREENQIVEPFGSYLENEELRLLFKSYGIPAKPGNGRHAFVRKLKHEFDSEAGESKQELVKGSLNRLSSLKKNELFFKEYNKALDLYYVNYFEFAKNLPAERIADYRNFLKQRSDAKPKKQKSDTKEKPGKTRSSTRMKRMFKELIPFEHFIHAEWNNKLQEKTGPAFVEKSKLKKNYGCISELDKLEFIKEALYCYNHTNFSEIEGPKPKLSVFFTRSELRLLFNSYGMFGIPEKVPINFRAYYFKLQVKDGKAKSMRDACANFATLADVEKEVLEKQYQKKLSDYRTKVHQYTAVLPLSLLDDFKEFMSKTRV